MRPALINMQDVNCWYIFRLPTFSVCLSVEVKCSYMPIVCRWCMLIWLSWRCTPPRGQLVSVSLRQGGGRVHSTLRYPPLHLILCWSFYKQFLLPFAFPILPFRFGFFLPTMYKKLQLAAIFVQCSFMCFQFFWNLTLLCQSNLVRLSLYTHKASIKWHFMLS